MSPSPTVHSSTPWADVVIRALQSSTKTLAVLLGILVFPGLGSGPTPARAGGVAVQGMPVQHIVVTLPAVSCRIHTDCYDRDPCTFDRCVENACVRFERERCLKARAR